MIPLFLWLCCLSTFNIFSADPAATEVTPDLPDHIAQAVAWYHGMSYGPTYNQEESGNETIHAFCLNAHHQIGVVKLDNNSLTFSFCDEVHLKIPDITKYPHRYFIYRSSYDQQAEQQIKEAHKQCKKIQKSSSVKSALKRYKKIIKKRQEEVGNFVQEIDPFASAYIIDLEKWAEIH